MKGEEERLEKGGEKVGWERERLESKERGLKEMEKRLKEED